MKVLEKCVILEQKDFSEENIRKTFNAICNENNSKMFFLLGQDVSSDLFKSFNLLKEVDKERESELTPIRFAYDLAFSYPTTVIEVSAEGENAEGYPVKSLSEMLKKFEYDDNQNLVKNYRIIIDDLSSDEKENDKKATENEERINKEVADLMQQIVFLNFDVDIQKKSEIAKKAIKDRFRADYLKLNDEILNATEKVGKLLKGNVLSADSTPMMNNVYSSLKDMTEEIKAARKRPLRIAAMGTKKAGKSVIINSLLNRDYAPTSLMLPTPNNVIYIPEAPGSELYLEYDGNRTVFHSAEDIKDYIKKEFDYAQEHTGKGSGLPDMYIHYPSDELTGFEIYDTPGPNFAGARVISEDGVEQGNEHEKIAVECIDKADVCIFVMNFATQLTNDEVNFLEKIRDSFARNNKFYSLFIALNRIDERYTSPDSKAILPIVDYIHNRLEQLNYKNLVVFATSALQDFYLGKVRSLLEQYYKEEGKEQEAEVKLSDIDYSVFSRLIKYYKKDDQRTQLTFIRTSLQNMEDIDNYEEPSGADLDILSGMPRLRSYCRYIGEQKADTEIVDAVVSRSDRKMVAIENSFIITNLTNLREQDLEEIKKLRGLMTDFSTKVTAILTDLDSVVAANGMKAMLYETQRRGNDLEEQSYKDAEARIKGILSALSLSKDDIKELREGNELDKFIVLGKNIDEAIDGVNKATEDFLKQDIRQVGTNFSKKIEDKLQKAQKAIEAEAKQVDSQLNKDSDVGAMFHNQFRLPTFPASLKKPESSQSFVTGSLNTTRMKSMARASTTTREEAYNVTVQVERKSRSIWESVRSFFGKRYYEDKTETRYRTVTEYNTSQFKDDLKDMILTDVNKAIHAANREMRKDQESKTEEMFRDLTGQCQQFKKEYKDIFDNFIQTLDMAMQDTTAHSVALEKDIKILSELKNSMQGLFTVWNHILKGEKGE